MNRRKSLKTLGITALTFATASFNHSLFANSIKNNKKKMWTNTKFTKLLNIKYPIVQGPFGGGLSSVKLAATVSNAGGLGSFGAQPYTADEIMQTSEAIRKITDKPFAINLWVTHQADLISKFTKADFDKLKHLFQPYFEEAGVPLPETLENTAPKYEDQLEGIFRAKPPVFSFVYGIPAAEVIKECKKQGIITLGTATTVDEALATQEAGIDAVVATGMEAGGHRVSFIRTPEDSLTGLFSLIPQVAKEIHIPIIAAGGIANSKGIAAALTLGADAVQIGTAFLACEESNATPQHKKILFSGKAKYTVLSKAFTGRLARGIESKIATDLKGKENSFAPYPLQSLFMSSLRKGLIEKGKEDYLTFWAGQSASLIKYHRAADLMNALVNETNEFYISK